MADRVDFFLRSGVRLVWIVDPDERNVTVYRQDAPPHVLHPGDALDGAPVLDGFSLALDELFAVLPKRMTARADAAAAACATLTP